MLKNIQIRFGIKLYVRNSLRLEKINLSVGDHKLGGNSAIQLGNCLVTGNQSIKQNYGNKQSNFS